MIIDLVAGIAVAMALVKGYTKGLIMALFNAVSILAGLAFAVKFSYLAAPWIHEQLEIKPGLASIVAFVVLFFLVLIIIRLLGKSIQKAMETVKLGFINRLAGMILYLVVNLAVVSVFLFYLEKLNILDAEMVEKSFTYTWIKPWGPTIIDGLGKWIPLFRNMFGKINEWLDSIPHMVIVE